MNTPISFELAKLLEEKGFDGNYYHYWNMVNHSGKWELDTRIWDYTDNYINAPTIAEVVMWLYEKHGVWISVERIDDSNIFRHCFSNIDFESPTEAYEAAIKYILENI